MNGFQELEIAYSETSAESGNDDSVARCPPGLSHRDAYPEVRFFLSLPSPVPFRLASAAGEGCGLDRC